VTGCSDPSTKIFSVKDCQQFSLNLCNVSKHLSFKSRFIPENKKNARSKVEHVGGIRPIHHSVFSQKRRHFADIAEVQQELLAALDNISIEDFRQCFQQWHWDRCTQSQREYFEDD